MGAIFFFAKVVRRRIGKLAFDEFSGPRCPTEEFRSSCLVIQDYSSGLKWRVKASFDPTYPSFSTWDCSAYGIIQLPIKGGIKVQKYYIPRCHSHQASSSEMRTHAISTRCFHVQSSFHGKLCLALKCNVAHAVH